MNDVELIVRGTLAGFAISAPVGPVNILCISRTLLRGRRAGLISGLGAAAADTFYGGIAGFSISFVINFLKREESWIRLVGGFLLIGIGFLYYFKRPPSLKDDKRTESAHSEFISAFILTLTNPTVVLSFLAVLAALGLGQHKNYLPTLLLIGGIFAGAMIWWSALAVIAAHFRDRVDDRVLMWMNRIAGLAVGAFGVITLILSRWHAK
jgi:threonine/homoserine/homoserine lactone efflux protein